MLSFIVTYLINLSVFLIPFVFLLLTIALTTLLERKVMGSVQRRRGPNVAGFFGFLQPIADGLKLFLKELIVPTNANLFLSFVAPVFTLFSSILLWLVIPFDSAVVMLDTPYSMLFLLAISSLSVYGIIFSGWASNSKYAFLGGLRSSAQMISYEVTISFVWLTVSLLGESLNICEIVKKQEESVWFLLPLLPLWVIFFIIVLAETNRAPFDLPEAEAELVAGYNVEYSSIAFALFFLGEYANMALMSSLCTLFFFGGWLPLFGISLSNFLWFGLKVTFHLVGFILVRATLPRYRYDQLMKLGWKKLMPITVVFLLFSVLLFFYIKVYWISYGFLFLLLSMITFVKVLFCFIIYYFVMNLILIFIYLFFAIKPSSFIKEYKLIINYMIKKEGYFPFFFPLFSNIKLPSYIELRHFSIPPESNIWSKAWKGFYCSYSKKWIYPKKWVKSRLGRHYHWTY